LIPGSEGNLHAGPAKNAVQVSLSRMRYVRVVRRMSTHAKRRRTIIEEAGLKAIAFFINWPV
jgi:hypothetical protein